MGASARGLPQLLHSGHPEFNPEADPARVIRIRERRLPFLGEAVSETDRIAVPEAVAEQPKHHPSLGFRGMAGHRQNTVRVVIAVQI